MAVKHLVENVRDIALVGHRAAGKTSLADALLFDAHAVDRLGSVDDGTRVADSDDEEHKHHFSIDTHVLHADHDGKHLNILDAPGSPDFIGAALEALSAVETAVVVVSAVNGVEMNTRRMFKEATDLGLSRAIVINKLDADNVDLPALVESIQAAFGKNCVLFNVPDRVGAGMQRGALPARPAADRPAGCPGRPARGPQPAHRGGRRVRRGADGEVPERRQGHARGTGGRHHRGRWTPARSSRSSARPRRRTTACRNCSTR